MKQIICLVFCLIAISAFLKKKKVERKIQQLDYLLPTPNEFRTGGGAPVPNTNNVPIM